MIDAMTVTTTAVSMIDLIATSNSVTFDAYAEYTYSDKMLRFVMFSVVMLSATMLSVIMLSVVMLSDPMLSVVMLTVVISGVLC